MRERGPVRLHTHKLVVLLLSLFARGQDLALHETDAEPDWWYVRWAGSHGGEGYLWIPKNDAELLETIELIRTDPAMAVRAQALLAVAFELDNRRDGFHLERVAELLHGDRDQLRSHRERQLPPIRRLLSLFERGNFQLYAAAVTKTDARAAKKRRNADSGRRRASYGGEFEGPLLRVQRRNRRTATVQLDPKLRSRLEDGPYTYLHPGAFLLTDPDHRNPTGRRPSKTARALMRLAAARYERFRRGGGKAHQVQAVQFGEFLSRWAGLDLASIEASGRTAAFLDVAQADLLALGNTGSAGLAEPVRVTGRAAVCQLRFTRLAGGRPQSSPAASWQRRQSRRPPAEASKTGSQRSHGPP